MSGNPEGVGKENRAKITSPPNPLSITWRGGARSAGVRFDSDPVEPGHGALSGKRVVVTRAPHQAEELAVLLREAGALPLLYPCIDIAPPEDTTPLDEALSNLAAFDWLILTSANTVRALANRFDVLGLPTSALAHLKIAAVGPATAKAARESLDVDAILPSEGKSKEVDVSVGAQRAAPLQQTTTSVISDEYSAESLARHLHLSPGSRVLLPQSEIASPALAESLAKQGADVRVVTAYRTVRGSGGDPVPQLLAQGEVDAVIFTSGSTIQHFLERLSAEGGSDSHLAGVTIACIGESTAQAARDAGLRVAVVPPVSTFPALVRSLEAYFDVR